MNDEWLTLLTPRTSQKGSDSSNMSTIESIFEVAGINERTQIPAGLTLTSLWNQLAPGNATRDKLVEAIVCSVVVDGLSRYGSHLVYQNVTDLANLKLASYEPLPNFASRITDGRTALVRPDTDTLSLTTLHVNIDITGFSYRSSVAGNLATVVLVAHLLLAIGHVGWIFWKRESSGCWSLVTELLALALNSRSSTQQIVNTGAGIASGSTFGHIVRIRAIGCGVNSAHERVELVFDETDSTERICARVDSNEGHEDPPSKVSTVSSFGLGTLFDDRAHTESTDALIELHSRAEKQVLSAIRTGQKYC